MIRILTFFLMIIISLCSLVYSHIHLSKENKVYIFSGGPLGGTYHYFAVGLSKLMNKIDGINVLNDEEAVGSTYNVYHVNKGLAHLGIAHSSDLYLARQGLHEVLDGMKCKNIRAISFLYKVPVQLAVFKDSNINKVSDLVGKTVNFGGPGSGASAAGKRYFKALGLWNKIKRTELGYSSGYFNMMEGKVNAMWLFIDYPNFSLIELSKYKKIKLLDTWTPLLEKDLDKKHPYYQPLVIKADAIKEQYRGVDKDTKTFHDSALWIAHKDVPANVIYKALKLVYSQEGLQYLVTIRKKAKQMTIKDGLLGVSIPIHPGALRFWQEKKLAIPEKIR